MLSFAHNAHTLAASSQPNSHTAYRNTFHHNLETGFFTQTKQSNHLHSATLQFV